MIFFHQLALIAVLAASGFVCSTATGSRRRRVRGAPPPPPRDATDIGGVLSDLEPARAVLQLYETLKANLDGLDPAVQGVVETATFLQHEVDLAGGEDAAAGVVGKHEALAECLKKHGRKAKNPITDYADKSEVNCGQPLSENELLCITGFTTESSMTCNNVPEWDKMEMTGPEPSAVLQFQVGAIFGGAAIDGGTPKEKVRAYGGDFFRGRVTFVDWSMMVCRGDEAIPAGNKWDLAAKQLRQRSEEMGLEGEDRMNFWSLASLVNIGMHAAHHYILKRKPLKVLYACTRNVELNHDNPTYGPVGERTARVYNSPHPESVVRFLGNSLVHTPEKLQRYARNVVEWIKPLDGETLGDAEKTMVHMPKSGDDLAVFDMYANPDNLSEEQLAARAEAMRAMCIKGGLESTRLLRLAQACKRGKKLSPYMEAERKYFLVKYKDNEKTLEKKMAGRLESSKKGGDTTAAKRLSDEETLSVLMDNDEDSVQDILDMAVGGSMNLTQEIGAFSSAMEEILRLKEEADSLIVWPAGDDNVVIVPSKSDVTNATYQYIVDNLRPRAKNNPNDWRIKASMKEGIDWRQYDAASAEKAGEGKVLHAGDSAKAGELARAKEIAKGSNEKIADLLT